VNVHANAFQAGLSRGWINFRNVVTTADGIRDTVFWNGLPLVLLIVGRNWSWPGTSLSFAAVAMPGVLATLVVFGAVMGPAYYLSAEREDGTLLRARALPHGIVGYMTGLVVATSLEMVVSVLCVLIPGLILIDELAVAGGDLVTLAWLLVLGLLATLPLGLMLGALAGSARSVGGLGMLIVGGLSAISGIFFPVQNLWGWLEAVAQAQPIYWLALGMRSVFLPDSAAALEIAGSWRQLETALVLGVWAAAGLALAPVVLRRMARRESGSAVEARRRVAMQRIG
jgi:ABC-2 type transport system permease protein